MEKSGIFPLSRPIILIVLLWGIGLMVASWNLSALCGSPWTCPAGTIQQPYFGAGVAIFALGISMGVLEVLKSVPSGKRLRIFAIAVVLFGGLYLAFFGTSVQYCTVCQLPYCISNTGITSCSQYNFVWLFGTSVSNEPVVSNANYALNIVGAVLSCVGTHAWSMVPQSALGRFAKSAQVVVAQPAGSFTEEWLWLGKFSGLGLLSVPESPRAIYECKFKLCIWHTCELPSI